MNESPDEVQWDDVVDVICVGSTPGVLAYLTACAAGDLDVLHLAAPVEFDGDTSALIAAMTDDLDPGPGESEPVTTTAVPDPLRRDARGRPDTLDPFVGERLRIWSGSCARSPFGVMFTAVPDIFVRMRTESGEAISAVSIPDIVDDIVEIDSPRGTFGGLMYAEGRLAGAVVVGESGSRIIRAEAGLALPIGPAGQWPASRPLSLVSRPAGRFARIEVLESPGHD